MGKLLVRTPQDAVVTGFPELAGVSPRGEIETRAMVQGGDRPLLLWRHELSPGAQVCWSRPASDQLVYVWSGEARFDGRPLAAGDVLIVEHAAEGALEADPGGVTLLHFLAPAAPSKSAGGHAHVINKAAVRQHFHPQTTITLYADATCASCDLWFHSGESPAGMQNFVEQPHSHSQDEIIVVVSGSLLVGPNRYERGTALAIDADTVYSFAVKEDELHFVNFRAGLSYVSMVEKGGGRTPPMSEREFITSLPTSPV